MGSKETPLMHAAREEYVRSGVLWMHRNTVGYDRELHQPYGLGVGSPDLVGGVIGSGRWFCTEVKAENGRLSKEQEFWIRTYRSRGAFVSVLQASSTDEARLLARAAIERALRGERE